MARTYSHGRQQPSLHKLPPHLQPGSGFDPSLGLPEDIAPLNIGRHSSFEGLSAGHPMLLDGNPSRHDPVQQRGQAVSSLPAGAYAVRDTGGDTIWLPNGLTLDQVYVAGRQAAEGVKSYIGKSGERGDRRAFNDRMHRVFLSRPDQDLAAQPGLGLAGIVENQRHIQAFADSRIVRDIGQGGRFDTQRQIARYPIPTPAIRGANRVVGVYMRGFFDRFFDIRDAPPSQHDHAVSNVEQVFRTLVEWPEWLATKSLGDHYAASHSENYRKNYNEFGEDDENEWHKGIYGP